MDRNSSNYKPEIDGLRAIAVLSVVLYHAFPTWLPGGFVGVDIFFVISGYLITKVITEEIKNGTFSVINFFERRIRRILPALYLMALLISLISLLVLFPNDLKKYGESLTSLPFFISNFYFWKNIDYFSAVSELRPLIHTWSLAVEEQFYVVYPFLMLFLFKKNRQFFIPILWIITLVSLILSIHYTPSKSVASFFLPFTRFWEISFGCLLYTHDKKIKYILKSSLVANCLALLGAALIFYSLITFSHRTLFPSVNALYPVIGTCLIIACSRKCRYLSALLSFKPLVAVGLLSYSIYIYHHPIFALSRHLEIFLEKKVTLLILTLALSFLSFKFVELPFRKRDVISSKTLYKSVLTSTILLVLTGIIFQKSNGLPERYNIEDRKVISQYFDYGGYNQKYFYSRFEKPFKEEQKTKVLLVGDSFARDFANIINESELSKYIQLSTWYVSSDCGNLFLNSYAEINKFLRDERRVPCERERFYNSDRFLELSSLSEEIWLVNWWEDHVIERMPTSIEKIQDNFNLKVRVFGAKNFGIISQRKILSIKPSDRPDFHQGVRQKAKSSFEKMDEAFDEFEFYYPIADLMCGGSVTKCKIFDADGKIISPDGGHLTQAGVTEAVKRLSPVFERILIDLMVHQ